jgi:putative DNA primase/helicase
MTAREESPEERARKARERFRIVQDKEETADAVAPDDPHLTDLGNAKRLVARHGQDLRFCGAQNAWLVWDGKHWAWDGSGEVERRAKETVVNLYREAADLAGKERHNLIDHARKSESATRIRAMIALAASEPSVPITMDELDADPSLLPCRNGTVELATGTFREHRREDLTTRLVPVDYDPLEDCDRWLAFLEEMVPDAETRAWIQQFFGYAAAGGTSEHVVPIAHGRGGNGKSTIVDVISGVLGPYVVHADIESFLISRQASGGGAATPDLARLKGARIVMASESGAGRKLNVSRIKDLAGGEPIVARELYGKPFEFTPHFSIWLSTNEKPDVPGNDFALWRRLRLIPFNVQIPDERRVLGLDQMILHDEAPGVLNWILDGLWAWQKSGRLPSATAIELATEEYRIENDPIGQWIEAACDVDPSLSDSASGLYGAFKSWFEVAEPTKKPMSQTVFGRELEKKGYAKETMPGGYVWRNGLKLRPSAT